MTIDPIGPAIDPIGPAPGFEDGFGVGRGVVQGVGGDHGTFERTLPVEWLETAPVMDAYSPESPSENYKIDINNTIFHYKYHENNSN